MTDSFYSRVDLQRRGLLVPDVRFAEEIAAFVAADAAAPPPKRALLLVGDSDIRRWVKASADTLTSARPVVNRGFGGARTWETVLYFEQTVMPSAPTAIIYCAGDNDIKPGFDAAGNIAAAFGLFLELVERHLPDCRSVFFLAVHLTPSTLAKGPIVDQANHLVRRLCEQSPLAQFVDYLSLLNDSRGRLREDCFGPDRLHFAPSFYQELADFLRPRIASAVAD